MSHLATCNDGTTLSARILNNKYSIVDLIKSASEQTKDVVKNRFQNDLKVNYDPNNQ